MSEIFNSMSSRNKNIVNLFADMNTVTVYQDYSEIIANYHIKVITLPTQVQASHDFIECHAMYRDHDTKGAALRHVVDEVKRKIELKRAGKDWK
jgi:hypothetical protein